MLALSTLLLLAAAARPSLALDTCTDSSKPIVITADTLLAIKGGNIVISKDAAACKAQMQSKTHVGEGECAYADQIAVGLNLAMEAFGITSMQRAAAAIGQMIEESAGFVYGRNHFGGCAGGGDGPAALCQPGKGTYAMLPPETLVAYAVTEGIITGEQAATLSGEEILSFIFGADNPLAYGPDFWWFDHAIKFRGEQSETCTSDWAEKVDNGDYKAWAWCLSNSKPLLDANLVPDAHVKTLIEGMKKQDCKPWQPAEPVAMQYPAGVGPINGATASLDDYAISPLMSTASVPEDWTYSGFSDTEAIATTVSEIGGGDAAGGDGDGDGDTEGDGHEDGGHGNKSSASGGNGNSSGGAGGHSDSGAAGDDDKPAEETGDKEDDDNDAEPTEETSLEESPSESSESDEKTTQTEDADGSNATSMRATATTLLLGLVAAVFTGF